MKRFRRIALAGIVWLTAASVLVAGTPHLVCACPAALKGATSSCCERCQPIKHETRAAKSGPKSCCCHKEPKRKPAPAKKPAENGPKLTTASCVKGLARGSAFTPTAVHKIIHKDHTSSLFFVANPVPSGLSVTPAVSVLPREVGPSPPPADVLTLCHRLLI